MNALAPILPWVLSALTLATMYLAGKKLASAWIVGLANQVLWLYWIVSTKNWGLLAMNIAITVLYFRNLYLWRQSKTTTK